MAEIPLTKGMTALVDDRDIEELMKVRWHASNSRGQFYAAHNIHIGVNRQGLLLMHRVIWEMHNGPIPPGMEIDHIDGNLLNNRLENFRLCNHAENMCNNHRRKTAATSRFKGVWKAGNRWRAKIQYAGVPYNLGSFKTEESARDAYNEAAREKHKSFAALNEEE